MGIVLCKDFNCRHPANFMFLSRQVSVYRPHSYYIRFEPRPNRQQRTRHIRPPMSKKRKTPDDGGGEDSLQEVCSPGPRSYVCSCCHLLVDIIIHHHYKRAWPDRGTPSSVNPGGRHHLQGQRDLGVPAPWWSLGISCGLGGLWARRTVMGSQRRHPRPHTAGSLSLHSSRSSWALRER
ncbi:uncharacterized protein LOC131551990 isoform X1 [Onychostoma macrolepis]|uniref:uncharacterized protein LOC131551990 isoform X1 n=1 Tax=Onychostoma macrolepis TaxID=369639 RepID=UPI00272978AA|nr:uncharacterized protein LOC131551990 isoform X1 [Onychostoma macrolepis]